MNEPWKNIQPKDTFFVHQSQLISDVDVKVLNLLYRPLIGVSAFSLYHAFLSMVKDYTFDSHEMFHADLFNELDMGLPEFYKARLRLEGLGLMRSFEKETEKNWLYVIDKPSSYQGFIQDDLLSLMLLNKVGERRFKRILREFPQAKETFPGFEEKTVKFVDVYSNQEISLLAQPQVLVEAKKSITLPKEKDKLEGIQTFDWDYFTSLIQDFRFLNDYTASLKGEILAIHQLFGLDELEMKKAMIPFIDYQTNELLQTKFKQSLVSQAPKKQTVPVETKKTNDSPTDLSAAEQALVATSEYYAPMLFLENLKESKKGLVVITERWAIEKLVKQTQFSPSVLNILIHYLLVAKNRQNFEEIEAFKIANEWSQAQITTPEAAIKFMREKEQTKELAAPKQNTYYKNNKVRKETLPDWVGKDNKETQMSAEEQSFFKEQLRQMRAQQKEGE